jgi:hypothetical protein
MDEKLRQLIILIALTVWLSPVTALEQEACQERFKSIDERIESGKYSDQNVQLAKQMRDSILQSCGFLDEASINKMMEGFEQLMPTKSAAERQADQDAKREERDAQRDAERKELEAKRAERERNKVVTEKPPVSEVLKRPPTAKSLGGKFVDRDDGMYYAEIKDWDLYRGKARVLYATSPSKEQHALGNSKQHFYVIESSANGKVAQKHVTDTTTFGLLAAGLRRGHDELILQWKQPGDDVPPKLERWSISDSKLLSSGAAPASPWGHYDQFRLNTRDGNILFTTSMSTYGKISTASWIKASPEGKVLASGALESDTSDIRINKSFHTRNGDVGLVTFESSKTDSGINSELAPIVRRIGGGEITAVVGNETRLLVTSDNATNIWESPPISRGLTWLGLPELGPTLSLEEREEMARIIDETNREYGGNIHVVNDAVVPVGDGYGVLIRNSSRGDEQRPVHGNWLYEYGSNGEVRQTYLNPAAEHIGGSFTTVAVPDQNSVFLYASPYVILLDKNRKVAAYGKAFTPQSHNVVGMISDNGGVWLIDTLRRPGDDELQNIWLERIEF